MEKIISEVKRKRNERDIALLEDYKQCMANGSDKTATYEWLANKYNLKRAASVYQINKKRKKKNDL